MTKYFLILSLFLTSLQDVRGTDQYHEEETQPKSFLTRLVSTIDPRTYSEGTKRTVLIGACAATVVASGVFYYLSFVDDPVTTVSRTTEDHEDIARHAILSKKVFHTLLNKGYTGGAIDYLTNQLYSIRLEGIGMEFPFGVDQMKEAGYRVYLNNLDSIERTIFRHLVGDLNNTVGGDCHFSYYGSVQTPCAQYNWSLEGVRCASRSINSSICNVTMDAVEWVQNLRGGGQGLVYDPRCPVIFDKLKGTLELILKVTNK